MIRVLALIVRRADITRDAFREHYETVHAPLATPELGGIPHHGIGNFHLHGCVQKSTCLFQRHSQGFGVRFHMFGFGSASEHAFQGLIADIRAYIDNFHNNSSVRFHLKKKKIADTAGRKMVFPVIVQVGTVEIG